MELQGSEVIQWLRGRAGPFQGAAGLIAGLCKTQRTRVPSLSQGEHNPTGGQAWGLCYGATATRRPLSLGQVLLPWPLVCAGAGNFEMSLPRVERVITAQKSILNNSEC